MSTHTSPDPSPGLSDRDHHEGSDDPAARAKKSASVLKSEEFSLAEAVGGPRGVVESVLPTIVFLVLYVITHNVVTAAVTAVAAVAVMALARIVQRQSIATSLGGLIGVGLGALLAIRSGEGTDFYLPGIITNAVALAVVLTTLVMRRPLVGIVIAMIDPRVSAWMSVPRARRAYTHATWLFLALHALRLAVQVPLLWSGNVAALGIARLVLGLPAFAVLIFLTWRLHQHVLAGMPQPETEAAPSAESGAAPARSVSSDG